jgi:hypothetical protein
LASVVLAAPAYAQQEADDRMQTIEVAAGPVNAVGIGYTRVFPESDYRGGLRLWYSFEERTKTFDHNVWDVFGIDVFGRRVLNPEAHVDVGLTLLGFAPEDDTDESGTFLGVMGAGYFGHRFLYAGIELRGGVTSLNDHMSLGIMASPRLKFQFVF